MSTHLVCEDNRLSIGLYLRYLSWMTMLVGRIFALYVAGATVTFFIPPYTHAGRPLVIDDASPVPSGNLEFEFGILQARPNGSGRDQAWPVVTLAYGLMDGVELGLAIQRINQDLRNKAPVRGFADLHLTTKFLAFTETPALPAVSLSLDLKLPTANRRKGLSTGRVDGDIILLLTKSFTPWAFHINLGYLIVDSPEGAKLKNVFHRGIAADWALNRNWALVGEVFGSSREAIGAKNDAAFQLGLRYIVMPGLVFDAAAGRSFRSDGTKVQGTLGLTWTFDLQTAVKKLP